MPRQDFHETVYQHIWAHITAHDTEGTLPRQVDIAAALNVPIGRVRRALNALRAEGRLAGTLCYPVQYDEFYRAHIRRDLPQIPGEPFPSKPG